MTRESELLDDDRYQQAQQQADREILRWQLTEILRRLAEGVIIPHDQVAILCIGCGIDKRDVF